MIIVFWPEQPGEYNNYRDGEHLGRTGFGMKEKSRIGFAFLKIGDIQMDVLIEQLIIRALSSGERRGCSQYSHVSLNYGDTF